MRLRTQAGLLFCLASMLCAFLDAGAASVHHCSEVPVRVSYEREADARVVCDAAHRAITFMTGHGFQVLSHLRVTVVHHTRSKPHLLGWFDPRLMEINILSFEDCASAVAINPPFGIPMDRAMHGSFIVHEIAHAIAQQNFTISDPSLLAHEYIAYTVQLATMDPPLREKILARYPLAPFTDESEITTLYFFFSPSSFAVKAYRHSTEVVDAATFIFQLLHGEVRLQDPKVW